MTDNKISKIDAVIKKVDELHVRALDTTNLKADYNAYKLNDIEITKQMNIKIETLNSQVLTLTNQYTKMITVIESLKEDIKKINLDMYD